MFGFFFTAFLSAAVVTVSGGAPLTFFNTNFIGINDSLTPPTQATPYPSTNFVSGLAGQIVTKVTVTVQGFSHMFPSDVDILLVGPQGQEAILMANVGGQDRYSVTNLTFTFDDDSTNSLPIYTGLTNGIFKPTNGYLKNLPFNFPSPAPPGNSSSTSALSVFRNTDPDGTWNLFVVDDVSGDSGSISNGWNLNLSVAFPLQIERLESNIVVSWPATATNWALQFSPNLIGSNAWSNVLTAPVTNAGSYDVTNPILGGTMFYRLIKN